jgi:hypothetical protein
MPQYDLLQSDWRFTTEDARIKLKRILSSF